MRLSEQAIAVLMITLQKCIIEQSNIVDTLRSYNFQFNEADETINILNPPTSIQHAEPGTGNLEEKSTVGSD